MLPILHILFFVVLGMSFGSFVTVLISRLYGGIPGVIWGRSQCSTCETKIPISQLIPVLSYLKQLGKSKCCKKRIPLFYPVIEIAFGALWGCIFIAWGYGHIAWPQVIITNILLILFFYDLIYLTVDRRITIPTIIFLFAVAYFYGVTGSAIYGALFGGSIFLIQYLVTRGRGIGQGDIDLGIILGAAVGFPEVLLAIVATYLLGTIILLPLWAMGRITRTTKIPLGIFLLPVTAFFLFFGTSIWEFYWHYPLFF